MPMPAKFLFVKVSVFKELKNFTFIMETTRNDKMTTGSYLTGSSLLKDNLAHLFKPLTH